MLIAIYLHLYPARQLFDLRGKAQLQHVAVSLSLRLHVRHKRQNFAQAIKNRPHRLGVDQDEVYVLAIASLRLEMELIQRSAPAPCKAREARNLSE